MIHRVAVIGCGKIADQHIVALQRVPNTKVVAVCDREMLMAMQLAGRFKIDAVFGDAIEMLQTAEPSSVHITTPPQSHFALARDSMRSGAHVYVEKPFTVTASEAAELVNVATEEERVLTAGHNYQFTLEMCRMRRLVGEGFLGGNPVHAESHWSYDLGDISYVGPVLGNPNHWVRQLPGQLLHNILSHGIARLAEFLDDDAEVVSLAHQSEKLRQLGGGEVVDELRALFRDGKGTTGYFCFSTQMQPGISQLRLCGIRNSLLVDQLSGTLTRHTPRNAKSYLAYVIPPLRDALQGVRHAVANVMDFLRGELYQDFGMRELMARYYEAIETGGPPPIPYREIVLTARLMDDIFRQVAQEPECERIEEAAVNPVSA
jgi:predicted dehydrogenase